MAVLMKSAWFKQREDKKMKILRHLSSQPDKSEYYHVLRSICQSELLADFIIFKEAVSELIAEGKVQRVTTSDPLLGGRDLVTLNLEGKNAGSY